jgi:peptide/nickel transport system substrate-binding protein
VEIAQVIQSQLAQIGITVNIEQLEYAGFAAKMKAHQTQMFVLGWRMQASPDPYFSAVFYSKSSSNWSNYNVPAIDSQMTQAQSAPTRDQANQIYAQMDQELIDDGAGVPIYYSSNLTGASSKVQDLVVDPFGNFILWNTWLK